jgi:DNA-binding PadR family transcriptional regulator
MTGNDDTLLEFLNQYPLALKPADIEYNIRTRTNAKISTSTINRRLRKLIKAGLVEKEHEEGGRYAITDRGRRYLDDDLSEDERAQVENAID